jgi:hypothetical protein
MNTVAINKWWDNLTHKEKESYIDNAIHYHWGKPISIAAITKYQKAEIYRQVHDLDYLKKLKDYVLNFSNYYL